MHHVRSMGSPKDDTRIIPLVDRLHMLTHEKPGFPCIERGKQVFERTWEINIEDEVLKHQMLYLDHLERQ